MKILTPEEGETRGGNEAVGDSPVEETSGDGKAPGKASAVERRKASEEKRKTDHRLRENVRTMFGKIGIGDRSGRN